MAISALVGRSVHGARGEKQRRQLRKDLDLLERSERRPELQAALVGLHQQPATSTNSFESVLVALQTQTAAVTEAVGGRTGAERQPKTWGAS